MPWRRSARIALRWTAVLAGLGLAAVALFIVYGVSLVDRSMASGIAGQGARVFSAPLRLRAGEPWTVPELVRALRARGFRDSPSPRPRAGEFVEAGDRLLVAVGAAAGRPGVAVLTNAAGGMTIDPEGGRAVSELTLPPVVVGTTAPGDAVRWPVSLDEVSPHLLTAIVDIEDRGFLSHAGLSLRGLLRAAVRDLLAGGVRQGGSTITQQLAKIMLLRPDRTVSRKVLEAWLAALIEYRYDKRAILEAYLNRVYLGQDGGWQIVGAEAGAQFYFGKRAGDLAVEEAALLAAIVAAPNRFDPFAHPAAATGRRGDVLAAMVREGHLAAEEGKRLAGTPLPPAPRRLRWPPAAQYVERVLAERPRPGAVLPTSLDPAVQEAVREGIEAALRDLEGRFAGLRSLARSGDPLQVAAVAMTPDGRVLALQGSRLGLAGEFNRALAARRQVGSLVKPFVVAAALEDGASLDDELEDAPISVEVGSETWEPENSDGKYRGKVSVADALVLSLNVPIVKLGLAATVPRVRAKVEAVGLTVPRSSPSLLLGAFEATPLEVARAYAALLDGRPPTPSFADVAAPPGGRAMTPAVAASVLKALEDVPRRGTAASLAGRVVGPLACKTGTTDQRRDSWFVAVRPRVVVAVWVGTDGNRETGLYGATGALEVWREIDERLPRVWRSGRFSG